MIYDVSIIICTYNPERHVFSRCLHSVQRLERGGLLVEILIIDNNSTSPIVLYPYVQEFLKSCPNSRIIIEKEQGLTYARKCGVTNSVGGIIIFFDDDNEVDVAYLTEVVPLFKKSENIVIWGPGKVTVDFLDIPPKWVRKDFVKLFQEKSVQQITYGCTVGYYDWTVNGTGMSIRREIISNFFDEHANSSITDRKGNSLSSGGDTQIVWYAIKNGLASGVSPTLVINHMISNKRCSLAYILRLQYSLANSYLPAFLEIFPEQKYSIELSTFPKDLLGCLWRGLRSMNYRLFFAMLSSTIGKHDSFESIYGRPLPLSAKILKKLIL